MLIQLNTFLATAIRADPVLSLAQAVCWLDPLWASDPDNLEDDSLLMALQVVRTALPEAYAQAVEQLRAGLPVGQIEQSICNAIRGYGIEIEEIERLAYGIPIPTYGARLDDPDFHESHPDVAAILAWFDQESDGDTFDLDETAWQIGKWLHESLITTSDAGWQQVGWALGWLFSCTGNSSVDLDWESLDGLTPLDWTPDNLAFARELIAEADTILRDVNAGLEHLRQPEAAREMQSHIRRLKRHLQKGHSYADAPRLVWRTALDGADRAAQTDAQFL